MHDFWVPGEEQHEGYRHIRDSDDRSPTKIRAGLEANWDQIKPYADDNFREEFALQPDARFWEMYLIVRMLNAGKRLVVRTNRPAAGPDLLIEDDEGRVWIEAVTFGHGNVDNPDRVPEMVFDGEVRNVPVTEIELRIATAFSKKCKKLENYIASETIAGDERSLIAINPGKVALHASQDGRGSPMCVLYPIGNQYVTFYQDSPQASSGYDLRQEIEKVSGVKVPIGMFADQQHNHVSGLIWSRTTLRNFSLCQENLTYFPNTTADNPLTIGWVNWDTEWTTRVDENGQCELKKVS